MKHTISVVILTTAWSSHDFITIHAKALLQKYRSKCHVTYKLARDQKFEWSESRYKCIRLEQKDKIHSAVKRCDAVKLPVMLLQMFMC